MFVYSIIFLLLLFGVFHYDYRKNVFLKSGYYFFTFLIFTLMTGLRYRVGGDALMYEDYFFAYPDLDSYFRFLNKDNQSFNYQPLYALFLAVCKSLSKEYAVYQFIHSVVVNTIIFWFIKKNTKYLFTPLLILYVFLFYFYFTFDIQREILAICCFLLGYKSFIKNKWLVYYFFAILAFLFHISASFLFILPLFKLFKLTRKFIIISLVVSIPLIIGKTVFIDFFKIFLFTQNMQDKGSAYSKIDFSITGVIFYYSIRVISLIPFLFYYTKHKLEGTKYDWLLSAMLIVSILSQVMVGSDRLNNYLYIPFILFFTEFLFSKKYVFNINVAKKFLVATVFIFLFAVNGIKLIVGNFGNHYYYNVFFPYESVFEKQENPERESFMYYLWKQ